MIPLDGEQAEPALRLRLPISVYRRRDQLESLPDSKSCRAAKNAPEIAREYRLVTDPLSMLPRGRVEEMEEDNSEEG